MTAQLPSRERLEERIRAEIELLEISLKNGGSDSPHNDEELLEVFRLALAAHEQEPVGYLRQGENESKGYANIVNRAMPEVGYTIPCYTHPAPVPAVAMPADLHPDTKKLVADFSAALAEKLYKAQLKYGYSDNWKRGDWSEQCLQHFHQHIGKGDPRDVAAYCAFMWHHGWKTESQAPVPAVPDEVLSRLEHEANHITEWHHMDEHSCKVNRRDLLTLVNACRAAMLNGGKS
ncbi:hypothetical protein [Citrobacter sp. RHBSTW-00881]|uniref:hypothetical protein n=1 Tax=Citrobacter sp. RHBSTW-00881 TaxID=2742667 RepID=UPI002E126E09